MDTNKVWVSGLVTTSVLLTKLPTETPIATFMLQVNEKFRDRKQGPQVRSNFFKVEVLGKNAEVYARRIQQGTRWVIEGYLRQDYQSDTSLVRVRAFAVYPDDSVSTESYKEGIRQAIEILKESRDKESAIEKLKEVLAS